MPKRSSEADDPNLFAKGVLDRVIARHDPESVEAVLDSSFEPPETKKPVKNPAAVALGKLGGSKGGKIRAQNLSPKKRSQIARKAARARWKKS